jgi:hypothetical protein
MYSELALYIVADILYILYAISLVKCRATAYYSSLETTVLLRA